MLRIFLILRHCKAGQFQHARSFFLFVYYGKETLTNNYTFISKKNRNSQITNKNEINEKKENERKKGKRTKKRKTNEKKKKCNKDILSMYEKVYSFNIKYHDNVMF